MKRPHALLPAVILVPALLLAGCGSDDDKSSADQPSSSVSESPSEEPTASENGLVELEADGFTVSLPGEATSSESTIDTPAGPVPAKIYLTEDEAGGGFVAALVEYPENVTVDLDGAVNGIAKGYGGKVVSNETTDFDGKDARQALISGKVGSDDFAFYVLAIDVDGKLFQMIHAIKGKAPSTPPAILGEVAETLSFD